MLESLFNPIHWKETPTQVFSCEYCEILKDNFFIEDFRWLRLEVTVQNRIVSFGQLLFQPTEVFVWNFLKLYLEKSKGPVFVSMNLTFLVALCTNSWVDSFPFKYVMFMIYNLIEPRMRKLILNHLIGNNCPEFHNGLLDSYFFKLTLGSDCLKLYFWRIAFKTILTQ